AARTVIHQLGSSCTIFFFSSRRRHTRFSRDWSSDVCSSDLPTPKPGSTMHAYVYKSLRKADTYVYLAARDDFERLPGPLRGQLRSEERRVGKERRSRWSLCAESSAEGGVIDRDF